MSRPKGSKNKSKVLLIDTPANIKKVIGATKKKIKDANPYHASIKVMGKFYEAYGISASEAIANIKPDGLARGVTVLVVKKGDKTQERILTRIATTRLFAPSQMIREVALKWTAGRFDL